MLRPNGLLYAIKDEKEVQTALCDRLSALPSRKRKRPSSSKEEEEEEEEDGGENVPDELKCSITTELMTDPVFAADGQTYERSAIEEWFNVQKKRTSPNTGLRLDSTTLTSNVAVKQIISRLHERSAILAKQTMKRPSYTAAALPKNDLVDLFN